MKNSFAVWCQALALCCGGLISASAIGADDVATNQGSSTDELTLTLGRACANDFYTGKTAALWARMSADMRKAIGDEQGLVNFQQNVGQTFGSETDVVNETSKLSNGNRIYVRTSRF